MPLHLDQFKAEQFLGYIENVPATKVYALEALMPNKNIFDIKFSYNVINGAYARTASIIGFNGVAPLRDKKGLEKMFGEVAKISHGFRLDEEELLRFNRPRSDEERDQAIEYVYDQTDELVEGVRDSKEWMRAQAIYKGALTYSENDVKINVDFGIPAENKIVPTKAWTDYALSTPLKDLQGAVKQFKKANKGKAPSVIHLSTDVEADLLQNASIKGQVYGSPTDTRIVTQDQLKALFSSLSIPAYIINDDEVDNGAAQTERLLPVRKVAMLGDGLGLTMSGVTVEKNYKPGMYVVPVITTTNPPSQEVYVGETVFPALQKPQSIVHLDI